jgi:hypothetical protein
MRLIDSWRTPFPETETATAKEIAVRECHEIRGIDGKLGWKRRFCSAYSL